MVYYILNFAFHIPLSYIIYHKSQSMDLSGPYGTIQDHKGPSWTVRDHAGPYRTILDHMGPYRTIRDHTGLYRTIRAHNGPYGTMQGHSGPYRPYVCIQCYIWGQTGHTGLWGHTEPYGAIWGHTNRAIYGHKQSPQNALTFRDPNRLNTNLPHNWRIPWHINNKN